MTYTKLTPAQRSWLKDLKLHGFNHCTFHRDNTITLKRSYFYTNSNSAKKFADQIVSKIHGLTIIEAADEWAAWPKTSYFIIKLAVIDYAAYEASMRSIYTDLGLDFNPKKKADKFERLQKHEPKVTVTKASDYQLNEDNTYSLKNDTALEGTEGNYRVIVCYETSENKLVAENFYGPTLAEAKKKARRFLRKQGLSVKNFALTVNNTYTITYTPK